VGVVEGSSVADNREQAFLEEAERLAQLPIEDQEQILAMHREIAGNPKVPKRERQAGLERVKALERHLQRLRRRNPNP
jgi:hypothetical protein